MCDRTQLEQQQRECTAQRNDDDDDERGGNNGDNNDDECECDGCSVHFFFLRFRLRFVRLSFPFPRRSSLGAILAFFSFLHSAQQQEDFAALGLIRYIDRLILFLCTTATETFIATSDVSAAESQQSEREPLSALDTHNAKTTPLAHFLLAVALVDVEYEWRTGR